LTGVGRKLPERSSRELAEELLDGQHLLGVTGGLPVYAR
jgi:hypothetical protein